MKKEVYIGKLDRYVQLFQKSMLKSPTGETTKTDDLYKNIWAQAEDKTANEEEEGKIYLVAIRSYTIRYDQIVLLQGEEMFVKDVDGDYHVVGIEVIGRKNYLRLKAIKRE